MPPYHRFPCWQACHRLAVAIYLKTTSWDRRHLHGLTSQITRAAYSAAANIAEGSAKRGRAEFRRYLDISVGSLAELSYALLLARDARIISDQRWQELEGLRDEAGRLTWRLYQTMRGVGRRPGV